MLFLQQHPHSAAFRNAIQDILWSDLPTPETDKRTRRELARTLDHSDLYLHGDKFDRLLDALWVLDAGKSGVFEAFVLNKKVPDRSLRTRIKRHIHDNPGDMSPEDLFDDLGALDCPHKRFALFLEGLASAEVRPDEPEQRRFAALANGVLKRVNAELRETAIKDGYTYFTFCISMVEIEVIPRTLFSHHR
jgi:hypothetical protein